MNLVPSQSQSRNAKLPTVPSDKTACSAVLQGQKAIPVPTLASECSMQLRLSRSAICLPAANLWMWMCGVTPLANSCKAASTASK